MFREFFTKIFLDCFRSSTVNLFSTFSTFSCFSRKKSLNYSSRKDSIDIVRNFPGKCDTYIFTNSFSNYFINSECQEKFLECFAVDSSRQSFTSFFFLKLSRSKFINCSGKSFIKFSMDSFKNSSNSTFRYFSWVSLRHFARDSLQIFLPSFSLFLHILLRILKKIVLVVSSKIPQRFCYFITNNSRSYFTNPRIPF